MNSKKDNHFSINDPSRLVEEMMKNETAFSTSPENQPLNRTEGVGQTIRPGDSELNSPDVSEGQERVLSEKEKQQYDELLEKELNSRLQTIFEEIKPDDINIGFLKGLRQVGFITVLSVIAVLGFILVGRVIDTVSRLESLPVWMQWLSIGILGVLSLIVVYVVVRLVSLAAKLKTNRKVDYLHIEKFSQRDHLQKISESQKKEGRALLSAYLREYPINKTDILKKCGMVEQDIQLLRSNHKELLENIYGYTDQRWINEFRTHFQIVIDRTARQRIKKYSRLVGIKTAMSPNSIIDSAIVITFSLSMLRDLMTLYHLKPNLRASVMLLFKTIGHAYLSGELDELTNQTPDLIGEIGVIGSENFAANLLKKVGTKSSEGIINGILISRIGKAAIAMLKPVN